jgi:PAS domain S-box-containing protein
LDENATNPVPQHMEDLEDLFENAPCGYLSTDRAGRIIKVNQTFASWTGYQRDPLVGRRFLDLLNIAGKVYYETHFAPLLRMQGFFNEVALDVVCANRARLPVLVNAVERRDAAGQVRFIRITVFKAADRRQYERELLEARRSADQANAELRQLNLTLETRIEEAVRERMQAEAELRQSQKMEAVGQLTGGIAHDFNNLLAGIVGSLELLQMRLAQGRIGELDPLFAMAHNAAKRAATLTHRLLAFSRRQSLDPRPTDLNRLVGGMEELIRSTMAPAVDVHVVAADELWTALVDVNQFENALLNLCINARDAMPDGGQLTIETGNHVFDAQAAREHELSPGQYVSLRVSDTGTGMPPEVIERAFDPFFTTKPVGQGTGLGLSMIYGFVRQSGGQVRICSVMGEGTAMSLYLPRHLGDADGVEQFQQPEALQRAGEDETVLVVDDEPTVRTLITEVLRDLGYTAIEAENGQAGLLILRSSVRINLLITDIGLPGGFHGRQLAEIGRLLRPDLKVLFISGHPGNPILGQDHPEPDGTMLAKPFTMEALTSRIRDLILQG